MTRPGIRSFLTAFALLAGQVYLPAQTNSASPNFQEVYDLIRQHAAGLSDAELNHAAVQGLIKALGPKVSLVTSNAPMNPAAGAQLVSETTIFDGNIAYLRIIRVDSGLADAVSASFKQLNSTNKVSGIVLDLRYTGGSDYKAAAAAADLFVSKNEPLLNWGEGVVSSHEKSNALTVPVAILVNHETAGAAEAFAATFRETGAGLILGSRTGGQRNDHAGFSAQGRRSSLRIASAPITLGDGSSLSVDGIKPDIDVTVSMEERNAHSLRGRIPGPWKNQSGREPFHHQPAGRNE